MRSIPSAAPAPGADAPPSRDLTGLKGVRVQLYSAPKNDPDTLYIGINDRDKAWHDLYKVKISTGEKTLVRKNTERIAGWIFDLKGQLRLADPHGRQRRHGNPARRTRTVHQDLLLQRVRELRAACASTKTASASTSRPTRATPWTSRALMLLDVATGKIETGRIRSAEARRSRRRAFLGSDRRSGADHLHRRRNAALFQGQSSRSGL